MTEFYNVKVYDLEESVVSCRNAMRLDIPQYTKKEFELGLQRAIKLVNTSSNDDAHCHDNFLTGIRVSFDMKYTQYITKQYQRYHWFDYVSSSSMMHRITKMDFSRCVNKYVSRSSIEEVTRWVERYNYIVENKVSRITIHNGVREFVANTYDEAKYMAFMLVLSNCPMGAELFVRVSTNYKQLQTIYHQRKNHKLKEDWGAFVDMVTQLPYAKEFIIAERSDKSV